MKDRIETSITNDFKSEIWRKYVKAIEKYKLIEPGDRVAVCVSGGKDSMLLAKLMQMSMKYRIHDVQVQYISVNPGFDSKISESLMENCNILGFTPQIINTDIYSSVEEGGGKTSPCFLCSRMRRGYLYREAEKLGCNKIALGHHYDDVIETILMSMLYGAQIQTMLPKLKSDNVQGMEVIRPLYLIREESIRQWAEVNALNFAKCSCRLTAQQMNDGSDVEMSTRIKVKKLLADLRHDNELVDSNVFGSVENVNVEKIIGYQLDGVKHNFMDNY